MSKTYEIYDSNTCDSKGLEEVWRFNGQRCPASSLEVKWEKKSYYDAQTAFKICPLNSSVIPREMLVGPCLELKMAKRKIDLGILE